MISKNVPKHLVLGARTGFLASLGDQAFTDYLRFTKVFNMDAVNQDLVDLGAGPMPVESTGEGVAQDFIEKTLPVTTKDWEIIVWLSHNAKMDDQTKTLESKVKSAGENFKADMSNGAFDVLENGDATTKYGACHDGLSLFNDAHKDAGALNVTGQDNKFALTLSPDNFDTVRVAGRLFLNDQNEPYEYNHNLLIINPTQERDAAQITNNPNIGDTTDRNVNPYAGVTKYITSAKITAGEWYLADESRTAKPVIVALREAPHLQHSWFDPSAPEGGRYYFKFYGRYDFYPGFWPTVLKGN
jgi:phage major head subunit gpT-like protein